ncbi:MAG: hypothetical protein ACFFCZ_05435 [Promethearchaeota archaeon]
MPFYAGKGDTNDNSSYKGVLSNHLRLHHILWRFPTLLDVKNASNRL